MKSHEWTVPNLGGQSSSSVQFEEAWRGGNVVGRIDKVALRRSGISQQWQRFYIASKFNASVVFNVLF